eukprot:TRINITY_DN13464_c0_g1_i4.p3 TRINITY_DN13464_c0_g1~~TRINITY_DN13464_c0_g1_i4.p3  ORF type:complete len:108 (+),score=30.40 TRINITY_DN13464_c0_g1_i4:445-768(+)
MKLPTQPSPPKHPPSSQNPSGQVKQSTVLFPPCSCQNRNSFEGKEEKEYKGHQGEEKIMDGTIIKTQMMNSSPSNFLLSIFDSGSKTCRVLEAVVSTQSTFFFFFFF